MSFNRLSCAIFYLSTLLLLVACSDKAAPPPNPAESTTAPISAAAQKYDGKIVRQPPADRGKDDGWYLVREGKRRWITDSGWLEKNGYQTTSVIEITNAEFSEIPEDPIPVK